MKSDIAELCSNYNCTNNTCSNPSYFYFQATTQNHPAGFPSVAAFVASQTLLNPMLRLLRVEDYDEVSKGAFASEEQDFGVDFSMPMLKTNVFVKGKHYIGMILHRQFLDVCFSDRVLLQQFPLSQGSVSGTY